MIKIAGKPSGWPYVMFSPLFLSYTVCPRGVPLDQHKFRGLVHAFLRGKVACCFDDVDPLPGMTYAWRPR